MDNSSFEKKKDNIDKRLKQLRNTKKDEESTFNDKMLEIKLEYERLVEENAKQKSDIEDQIIKTVA